MSQKSNFEASLGEAIYFITELALAANPADFEALYGTSIPEPSPPGAPFRTLQNHPELALVSLVVQNDYDVINM